MIIEETDGSWDMNLRDKGYSTLISQDAQSGTGMPNEWLKVGEDRSRETAPLHHVLKVESLSN